MLRVTPMATRTPTKILYMIHEATMGTKGQKKKKKIKAKMAALRLESQAVVFDRRPTD